VGWVGCPATFPCCHCACAFRTNIRTHRCSHRPHPVGPPLQAFEKITGFAWDRKNIRWEWTDCNDRSQTASVVEEQPKEVEEPVREEKQGGCLPLLAGLPGLPAGLLHACLLLLVLAGMRCRWLAADGGLLPGLAAVHPMARTCLPGSQLCSPFSLFSL
jgi:hypothetical protein